MTAREQAAEVDVAGWMTLTEVAREFRLSYDRMKRSAIAAGVTSLRPGSSGRLRLVVPASVVQEWRAHGIPCSSSTCANVATTRSSLCEPCIDRRRWHVGEPRLSPDGYVMVKLADRTISQHRLVMEQLLGRRLTARENVHHINGNKTDNRPANLELWVRPQSAGQRVADLVAFIVDEYRELVLDRLSAADQDVAS